MHFELEFGQKAHEMALFRKEQSSSNGRKIDKEVWIVDGKVRVGDLELDTIIGAKHKEAIVSIDRKRKKTWFQLISHPTAKKNN